jgi:hypothetical protein
MPHEQNPVLQSEFTMSMCGRHLGAGIGRRVFEYALNPDTHVVKFEDCNGSRFQNVLEWETWQRVKGTRHERWFAPCVWISQSGGILIMRRTTRPVQFPAKMPAYLCDFKRDNYGLLDGKFVCHDYGTNLLIENGLTSRMRKAEWWD